MTWRDRRPAVMCVTAIIIWSPSVAQADSGSSGGPTPRSTCSPAISRGWCGDGGPATEALLNDPHQVAPLASGGFLIADTGNNVIRKVDASGVISTVAGTPMEPGNSGDGGQATHALLDQPMGVVDLGGGAFAIADTGNHVVRMVDASGTIRTLAGGFSEPRALARAANGYLLVADAALDKVFAMSPVGTSGVAAGTGTAGSGGDGGPAEAALLDHPTGVAVDPSGDVLVADAGNRAVRQIAPDGTISTVLTLAGPAAVPPVALAVGTAADGSVLVGDGPGVVRASSGGGPPVAVAGTGVSGFNGDSGSATTIALGAVGGVAPAADGSILITDSADDRIRSVSAAGQLTTVAGSGVPAPSSLTFDIGFAYAPPVGAANAPANTGSCPGLKASSTFRVSFPYANSPIVVHRAGKHPVSVILYASGNAALTLTIVAHHRRIVVHQQLHTNNTAVNVGNLASGSYGLRAKAARSGSYSCATDHLHVKP
ncbi:MAG TPA: hypothetical protein VFR49_06785 [Solirubrobacteraceae bacterium]|nr:hypothetical protein [Solirubrobacteraceae bacterium]